MKTGTAAVLFLALLAGCAPKAEVKTEQPSPQTPPAPTENPRKVEESPKPKAGAPKKETPKSSQPITVVDLHGQEWSGTTDSNPPPTSPPVRLAPSSRPAEIDSANYAVRTGRGHLYSMTYVTPLTADEVIAFYEQELNSAHVDRAAGTIKGMAKGYEVTILVSQSGETMYEIQVWA